MNAYVRKRKETQKCKIFCITLAPFENVGCI